MSGTSSMYDVIKRPLVTEKTNQMRDEHNQYVFEVTPSANKVEIRSAVEKLFGVRVVGVQTVIRRGKIKRLRRMFGKQPNQKRAIVTLHWDDSIELFEGV